MHIMNASPGSVAMSAGPVVGSAGDDEILRGEVTAFPPRGSTEIRST
jgi:hypothetical protein